jgi:hypothetical protein
MGVGQSKDGSDGNAVSEAGASGRQMRSPKLEDSGGAPLSGGAPNGFGNSGKLVDGRHVLEGDLDSTVPTVFKWEHGGREVGGSFLSEYIIVSLIWSGTLTGFHYRHI